MSRQRRLQAIVRIVGTRKIRNQAELAEALRKAGHGVTQPTLSRDIAELGLVKGQAGYSLPEQAEQPTVSETELRATTRRFVLEVFLSNNLVMVKTFAGSAHFVAYQIDRAGWPDLVGTISGDDTILVMGRNNESAQNIDKRIRALMDS